MDKQIISNKKKVLIVNPFFLPGYRSGGPQQTVKSICDVYSKKSEIYLLTLNHDLGVAEPYDLPTGVWLNRYGINIKYLSPKDYCFTTFKKAYKEFDTIYACGLFCLSTIQLMIANRIARYRNKLYIAPMGVFGKNAITIKYYKKKVLLTLFSLFGVFKRVVWSFTSNEELMDAYHVVGGKNILNYIIAEDLPRAFEYDENIKHFHKKKNNQLKIVFLSRISVKKNLLQAIEILDFNYSGKIIFDIYGPKEDQNYWDKCRKKINNIVCDDILVTYKGEVLTENVLSVFSKYDVFLFPTKSENYGHVIFESLASGCLPIISDMTPWKNFDKERCGSVVSLEDTDLFRKRIEEYIIMDTSEFSQYQINAIQYAQRKYLSSIERSGYNTIFLEDESIGGEIKKA